jgi:hypothetical protein
MATEQASTTRVIGTRIIGTEIVVLSAWEHEGNPLTGETSHAAIRSAQDFGEGQGWYGKVSTKRPEVPEDLQPFTEERVRWVEDHYKAQQHRAYSAITDRFPPLADTEGDAEAHWSSGEIVVDLETYKGLLAAEEMVDRELLLEALYADDDEDAIVGAAKYLAWNLTEAAKIQGSDKVYDPRDVRDEHQREVDADLPRIQRESTRGH